MGGELVARRVGVDRVAGALAARQHGVAARRQLIAAGVGRRSIDTRLAAGAWTAVHRGVYAIGHAPLTRRGVLMAAVLACGEGALLSHATAAELWGLVPGRADRIHVSVSCAGGRARPGVRVHRRPGLCRAAASSHGIPVTSPAQTILDHAARAGRRGCEKMLDQARLRRLCSRAELQAALEAGRGTRGAAVLRAVLAEHEAGSTVTRSELEERFLALCRRARLARPLVNAGVHDLTLDFFWPDHGVAVETDGWAYHHTPEALQRDADRGNRLALAGIMLLRFTYADVTRQGERTVARLRSALRQGRRGSPPHRV